MLGSKSHLFSRLLIQEANSLTLDVDSHWRDRKSPFEAKYAFIFFLQSILLAVFFPMILRVFPVITGSRHRLFKNKQINPELYKQQRIFETCSTLPVLQLICQFSQFSRMRKTIIF